MDYLNSTDVGVFRRWLKAKLKRLHKKTEWGTEYVYYIEDDATDG